MSVTLEIPLGKATTYVSEYSPELIFPIPRQLQREEIQVPEKLPFHGYDIWNAYEVSWLNTKGKPMVAVAQFIFQCESVNLIESKSFKLYLNSFNNTKFASQEEVVETMKQDLGKQSGLDVEVIFQPLKDLAGLSIEAFDGDCIDELDVSCDKYEVDASLLVCNADESVEETLYSNLLKSNCLVTGQPDWATVQIQYRGKKISRESLLQYIVSFRNHNEFHEQCVERMFVDIMRQCQPEALTVYGRYTRRGGLDINPVRSTKPVEFIFNPRLGRQ